VLKAVVTAFSRQRVRRSLGDYLRCTVWAVSHGVKESHAKNTEEEKHIDSRTCLELNAAGGDVGATEIYIAVPADRDPQPARRFSRFTEDLHVAADWLKACGIETVAMESTGVYWIPFFQILEARGFRVLLVHAHHVKNVPGRKSDVSDCQWIQYLLSVGLLRASFRPEV